MNIKRLAALTALSALLSTAAPALALSVNSSNGNITVEWNYAVTASFNMYTQTSASAAHSAAGEKVYWVGNGSTASGCEGTTDTATAGTDTSANLTVNYGNVVADNTDYTDCLEVNAIDLNFATNDSNGATFAVSESGAPSDYDTATDGSLLCLMGDGWTEGATAASPAWTASTRVAAVAESSTTACSAVAGSQGYAITSTSGTFFTTNNSANGGADLNQDLQLQLGPKAQSGQQTVTVTYTMTTN